MVLVTRLCLRARQRFSALAVDCLKGQKVLSANPVNRTIEHRGARRPLADLSRDCRYQLCIGGLAYQTESLLDLFVRDNAEKGGLFQLDGEPLPQRAVEDRIAGGVGEVREHQHIFVRGRFGVRALLPKEGPDGCQNNRGDCSDPVPQQRVFFWADGNRSCVRFQELGIFARCGDFMSGLISGVYPVHFRNKEPISSLWNCLNVSGIVGVIVQRLTQLAHCHAESAIKINERIARPEAASKFLSADDLSGVFEQRDEEPIGLLL
jgi:hypothetical protein